MKTQTRVATLIVLMLLSGTTYGQKRPTKKAGLNKIITGAEQTDTYVPYLKGKRVAMLANPTSVIGKTHLVDSLQKLGITIVKVFGPEHGFRGNASAGVKVADEKDPATGIPIISLYGPKNKPTKEDLADVDVMV